MAALGAVKEEEKDDKGGILSVVAAKSEDEKLDLNRQIVFFQTSPGGSLFQSLDIDDISASREFNSPVEMTCVLKGSANGLICLAPFAKGGCFIWNPCTGETKKISVPIARASSRIFGFGYDSCSDDYKILADWGKRFRVFSLKTNSWKVHERPFLMSSPGFHFNGALHWFVTCGITAFDVATESSYCIQLPDELKSISPTLRGSIWAYQGFLCVSGKMEKSIWMMKKYRDAESWVKLSQVLEHTVPPLGITRLGEVVFQGKYGVVKSNNQGRISNLYWFNIKQLSTPAFIYKESLISPSCFDSLHSKPEKTTRRPTKQRKITAA